MPIGWFADLAAADALLDLEWMDHDVWTDLPSDAVRTTCLYQSYNRLYYSKEFILPTYADATAADLVVLTKAQAEMAVYLALHINDESRRKGIQAQGVVKAGVVKEDYDKDLLLSTPLPPFVRDLLCAYLAGEDTMFGAVDLCRDEEESVNTKICDF
jgi:hypothetical protein